MPKIASVDLIHVSLPTRRAHKWTGATEPVGGYLLVRLTDDDGRAGWGEAPVLKDWGGDWGRYYGETPVTTAQVIRAYLAQAAIGTACGDMAGLHRRMDRAIRGYPYAKAAIDIAAYDLAGRTLGVSAAVLLGGIARDRVAVTHSIGFLDFPTAEREAARVVEEGIRTIKIKTGVDPARDVEMVRRIRDTVGPDIALCVDANQGYRTPREAIRTIRAMEPAVLAYAEQPVEGIDRLAEVAHAVDTPIMADESAWTARDALEIAEKRAASIVSIYTTKPGGLYRALEVAAVCRAAGLPCNVNGSIETGIGNRANLLFAAAVPAVTMSCVIPISTPAEQQGGNRLAGIYYTDDLLTQPMAYADGSVAVPTGPGLGLDVDEERIARYRISRD